ncbi:Oidioi.mRNA.OKI2018_I69.PAR.g10099.t1.cds [Oikopleura dioica]|uniref:Oidioi.mRNA.OKI2018_I69.PAR.g10099.t1.cds n=1 Tax=Oikopleura dioica TaxID=34765 RepID=A0ABN7RSG0_OIKDI|nr:Oidioi.mRNA.OKI2018_I69.PAR.g10099.t1.cds [Oikopleura dioica]
MLIFARFTTDSKATTFFLRRFFSLHRIESTFKLLPNRQLITQSRAKEAFLSELEVNIAGSIERFELKDEVKFDDSKGRFFFGGSSANIGASVIFSKAVIRRDRSVNKEELSENPGELIFSNGVMRAEEKRRVLNRLVAHSKSKYPSKDTCPTIFKKANKGVSPKEFQSPVVRRVVMKCWNFGKIMDRINCLNRELENNFMKRLEQTRFESLNQNRRRMKSLFQSFDGLQCDGTLLTIFLKSIDSKNYLFPYLMLAADKNCALALLVLAKIHESSGDLLTAAMYYSYAAQKAFERRRDHPEQMVFVDEIRLNDEKALDLFEGESGGVYNWLLDQATKGVQSAQNHLASVIYHGKTGVKKNLSKAFKFFQQAAKSETTDPDATYNLGLMKMKGQGSGRDIEGAVEDFQKVVESSAHAPSLNALGHYHLQEEKNAEKAKEYFEKAAELGDPDAMHNLAIINKQNLIPNQPRDDVYCFGQFYRAAQRGHIESAYQLVLFYSDGIPGSLPVVHKDAVVWAKFVLSGTSVELRQTLQNGLKFAKKQPALSFCFYGLSAIASSDLGAFNAAFLISEKFNKEADLDLRFLKLAVENTTYLPYRQAQTLLGERLGPEEGERHLVAAAKGMCPRAMFSLASGTRELSGIKERTLGFKVADYVETTEFLSDVWVDYLEGRCPIRRVIEEYKKHGFQANQDIYCERS